MYSPVVRACRQDYIIRCESESLCIEGIPEIVCTNAPPRRGFPRLGGALRLLAMHFRRGRSPLPRDGYCAALMFWMCVHVPVMDPGKT